jgi:hypothetical protein
MKDQGLVCRVVHGGLKPKEEYYVNRTYKLVGVPDQLQGLTLLQTRCGNKAIVDGRYAIVVTSPEPCYCFVAISEQSVRGYEQTGMPGWLEEFSLTKHRITTDDPRMNYKKESGYAVLVREAPAGRIALGPACNYPYSMYFAFFGRSK